MNNVTYVYCPVCGNTDCRRVEDSERFIIFCTNTECGSNGGTNFSTTPGAKAQRYLEYARTLGLVIGVLQDQNGNNLAHHFLDDSYFDRMQRAETDVFLMSTSLEQVVRYLERKRKEASIIQIGLADGAVHTADCPHCIAEREIGPLLRLIGNVRRVTVPYGE